MTNIQRVSAHITCHGLHDNIPHMSCSHYMSCPSCHAFRTSLTTLYVMVFMTTFLACVIALHVMFFMTSVPHVSDHITHHVLRDKHSTRLMTPLHVFFVRSFPHVSGHTACHVLHESMLNVSNHITRVLHDKQTFNTSRDALHVMFFRTSIPPVSDDTTCSS